MFSFGSTISVVVLTICAHVVASYNCEDFFVPITVTAPSYGLVFPPFENRYQEVAFLNDATSRDAATGPPPITTTTQITASFNISTRYCTPSHPGRRSSTVQVLTHGLGFDKHYWDFGGETSDYNYILAATDAGYSTLSHDRQGTGLSTFPDPYIISQSLVELAVLAELTVKLRSGLLVSGPHGRRIAAPSKVVHVGHSYGSILSNALVATKPALSDGLMMQGFTHNESWIGQWLVSTLFHQARENMPERYGNLSTGYITWGDVYANAYGFFAYPNFDPAVIEAAEATKNPFTIGEALTGPPVPARNSPGFVGPVLMINGAKDLLFCGGDCTGVVDGPYAVSKSLFPKASAFESYLQPTTGHAMNLHLNSTGTYGVMLKFLEDNLA